MSDFYICEHKEQCCGICVRGAKRHNNELETENKRLREALEKIMDGGQSAEHYQHLAEQALKPGEGKP